MGGSGIKGCLVDLDRGELIGERVRIPTPQPALPDAVCDVIASSSTRAGSASGWAATAPTGGRAASAVVWRQAP